MRRKRGKRNVRFGGKSKAVGRLQTKYMKRKKKEIETGYGVFYEMSWSGARMSWKVNGWSW